ncbi:MAG TPA: PilZ domain-containing protein [Stellaceae bacterium]|nr:PilZ domain-containing protein [Stellaceae bacterium]
MGIGGKAEAGTVNGTSWQERRRHRRKPVMWAARLETASGVVDCTAFDLSLGGAKLRLDGPVALHHPVQLVLARLGVIAAEAVWQGDGTLGLRFTEPAETVRAVLGCALPL